LEEVGHWRYTLEGDIGTLVPSLFPFCFPTPVMYAALLHQTLQAMVLSILRPKVIRLTKHGLDSLDP
jgi:hypothetical protein